MPASGIGTRPVGGGEDEVGVLEAQRQPEAGVGVIVRGDQPAV